MNEKQIYENLDSSIKLLNENVRLKKTMQLIKNKAVEYKECSKEVENGWAEQICNEMITIIESGEKNET